MAQPTATPILSRILQRGELIVGTAGSMPPLNMTTKEGKVIGFEIDLARYFAATMGVELKLEVMPFAELLPALEKGEIDMILSGMTITSERNLKVAFVGPYFISGKAFLTKIETIASPKDYSEIDSPKTTLAALKGSTSQLFVESVMPKAKLVTTKHYDEAVDMVIQGKVDAMVADYPICVVSVLRYPYEGLVSVITPLTFEPLGIAVPPGDSHLINWLENSLRSYEGTGGLKEAEKRWFQSSSWLRELP
jgi:polar amino acid transport system substrate-binding protein